MSISAGHWAIVMSNVREHARKLHPNDPEKQRTLMNELLGITTAEDLDRKRKEFLKEKKPTLGVRIKEFFKLF